jgi:hypothetical protein
VIKRIADERTRIDNYEGSISDEDFFNDRRYKEDLEWLTLAYLVDILSSVGWLVPEYAMKIEGDGQPDFQTYLTPNVPHRKVEVTEVLRPGYKRGAFYRSQAARGQKMYQIGGPHPEPWSSFRTVLSSKLDKPYSDGAWLLVYHDMGYSDFQDGQKWHERTLVHLRKWTSDSKTTCDITRSRYENIFVIDSSGQGAVRLHPHWDVINELSR